MVAKIQEEEWEDSFGLLMEVLKLSMKYSCQNLSQNQIKSLNLTCSL